MLTEVVEIVKKAKQFMVTDGFEIIQKDGIENIVTSSDVAVQNFLIDNLKGLIPGCGFYCEENDLWDSSHEYTWIIDPIDGTANYSRGIDQCAICVGLKYKSEMILGVVYLPRTNELFCAEKGKGATLNGKSIRVSDRSFKNGMLCAAMSVYHKQYARTCSEIIYDAYMQCNDFRRFGAAAPEICYLAMGRCEMFFEYQLSPWDYAAASVILTEAGGYLSDLHAQAPQFTKPTGIIAANSKENLSKMQEIVISKL